MELLAAGFDSEYFKWLLEIAAGGVVFGVIVPMAFWGLGTAANAFFKWAMA